MVHTQIPYGTTECSPAVTSTAINDSRKHQLESVGRPLDHIEIKVVDPITGALKTRGEPGEVAARGHSTFIGYWDNEEKTKEAVSPTRWYHTG